MISFNNYVFAANWSNFYIAAENNTIQIINTNTDQLIDSIIVSKEPNSMVIDKNNKLWVLCSGGYMNDENPALYKIDPITFNKELILTFQDINGSPNDLTINGAKDSLFFINHDIFCMPIESTLLPIQPIISSGTGAYYSLVVDDGNSTIYAGFAGDYQQNAYVFRYKADGSKLDSLYVGIAPGDFCFNNYF